jgi:asparagine synthase (glutamine-hydrolysing)
MCGVAGIAGPGAGTLTGPLRAMRAALGHRGPDAEGEKFYADCALGHTRLSIIDLANGGQPFEYGAGQAGDTTCVVFNGEIYGYLELRGQISAPLRSASDTELIPALYAEHGVDLCRFLPGMFAFGLWDEPNKRLVCGRDRFGEKPLYWATTPDGRFVFASELPALLASGLVRPRLNLRAVSAYLALRYVPEGMTIYEDVHLLPPGHALVFEAGSVRTFAYWTAPAPFASPPAFDEAREEFRRLMAQAVRRCIVADVEVAVLLSGGLDSTTIAALASQEARLHAFSFGFEGARNELPFARDAAARYGLPLIELDEGELDLPAMLLDMPRVYGEPFADPSAVPTCALCRRVAEHVKVAVGGDGGDELLAGYSWYKPLLEVEQGVVSGGWSAVAERHWRLNTYFQPEQIAALGLPEAARPRLIAPTGTLDDALRLDVDTFLAADILRKVDRAAMASHLELRSPFLERDLAEFLLALPWQYKAVAGRDKILLREAFSSAWPESIRSRGKQGFGANVFEWQKRPDVMPLREHYLFGPNRRIRQLFAPEAYARCAADTANLGWLLLVLSIWLESAPCELP